MRSLLDCCFVNRYASPILNHASFRIVYEPGSDNNARARGELRGSIAIEHIASKRVVCVALWRDHLDEGWCNVKMGTVERTVT